MPGVGARPCTARVECRYGEIRRESLGAILLPDAHLGAAIALPGGILRDDACGWRRNQRESSVSSHELEAKLRRHTLRNVGARRPAMSRTRARKRIEALALQADCASARGPSSDVASARSRVDGRVEGREGEPTEAEALLERARRHTRRGEQRRALLALEQACCQSSEDARVWTLYAAKCRSLSRYDDAERALRQALWLRARARDSARASVTRRLLQELQQRRPAA